MFVAFKKSKIIFLIVALIFSSLAVAKKKPETSLAEASEFIRKQSQGKVLSAITTHFGGIRAHRIKVLTPSGRVRIYQVPVIRGKENKIAGYIYNGRYYDRMGKPGVIERSSNFRPYQRSRTNGMNSLSYPRNYRAPTNLSKGASSTK